MTLACDAPNPDGGRNRLNIPCVRSQHHAGLHRDRIGRTWEAAAPSEAKSAALLAFEAECDALDALSMKRDEWRYLDAKLTALHKRQFEGDDSELTRQRINRLEALQACMCGDVNALAQEVPARRPYRA